MQDAALDLDDYGVKRPNEGPTAKRFIIQFTGQTHLAARAVRQAMSAIKQRNNTWRRFYAEFPSGGQTDLFISVDKHQATIRRELGIKLFRREFGTAYPN
eukprot:2792839-Pyramimonas_sp.AAC.1